MNRPAPGLDGWVLAGGLGTRMGVDKARVAVPGIWGAVPLASLVADTLSRAGCARVSLIRRAADADPPFTDGEGRRLPVLREPAHAGTHPLWGVAAGLHAASSELVVFAPCDLPNLRPRHVRALLEVGGPAVAACDGHRHPLLAVLPSAWAARALELARSGGAAQRLVAQATAVELDPLALVDANRPADLPPDPLAELIQRLPRDARASEGLADGELSRQAARGATPRAPR